MSCPRGMSSALLKVNRALRSAHVFKDSRDLESRFYPVGARNREPCELVLFALVASTTRSPRGPSGMLVLARAGVGRLQMASVEREAGAVSPRSCISVAFIESEAPEGEVSSDIGPLGWRRQSRDRISLGRENEMGSWEERSITSSGTKGDAFFDYR